MPPKRRSNLERRQESTEAVLDAALSLFVSRGYQATTMADIAGKAGLTKGAVYFYFKDKLALVTELLDRSERTLYRPFFDQLEESNEPAQIKISQFLNWLARIAVENRDELLLPVLISLEFHDEASPALDVVRSIRQQMKSKLVDIFNMGHDDGTLRMETAPEPMAEAMMAFSDGLLLQWYRSAGEMDGEALSRSARDMVLNGIKR